MTLGVMLGFNLVMIVNIQLAVEIKHWTWAHYAGLRNLGKLVNLDGYD
jgi:hypothetical protein